jgi:hypothetical protein
MAEEVRFELTVGCPTPVFKTGALDHSATPPMQSRIPFLREFCYGEGNGEGANKNIKAAHDEPL